MNASTVALTLTPPVRGLNIRWPRQRLTHDPSQPIPMELRRTTTGGTHPGADRVIVLIEGGNLAPLPGLGTQWQLWQTRVDGHSLVRLEGIATGNELTLQVLPDLEERNVHVQAQWGSDEGEVGVPLQSGFKQTLRETLESIVYAFFIAIVLRTFLFQAFYIPSESMVPTLEVRDRLVANKFLYHFREPATQEIVIFRVYQHLKTGQQVLNEPPAHLADQYEIKDYIKRLIAQPGQYLMIRDGIVYVDNQPLAEPYLTDEARLSMSDFGPYPVPEGHVFMMGDNRGNSKDSRYIGAVPRESVVGKAHFIFWPPDNATWLK